jgi:hypothetical protein
MQRLERADLENPDMRAKLAEAAKVSLEELDQAFAAVVGK